MKRLDETKWPRPSTRPPRDPRRRGPRPRRDRDVGHFGRDETETRRWYVSRPSRDRDVETETTSLTTVPILLQANLKCRLKLVLHCQTLSNRHAACRCLETVNIKRILFGCWDDQMHKLDTDHTENRETMKWPTAVNVRGDSNTSCHKTAGIHTNLLKSANLIC